MAEVVRYVNGGSTAGGDGTTSATTGANRAYATFSAWTAAEATNLVTDGDTHKLIVTGSSVISAVANLSGWTMGPSNGLTIVAEGADRYNGAFSTSKPRITNGSGASPMFRVNSSGANVIFDGLQFVEGLGAGASEVPAVVVDVNDSTVIVTVKNCYSDGCEALLDAWLYGQSASDAYDTVNVLNNVIRNGVPRSIILRGTGTQNVINNTAMDSSGDGILIEVQSGEVNNLYNNISLDAGGSGTDYDLRGSGTRNSSDNYSSDSSSPNASGDNWVEDFTDAAGGDFSVADTDLQGTGFNVTSFTTESVNGETRVAGSIDVGAYQAASSGASGTATVTGGGTNTATGEKGAEGSLSESGAGTTSATGEKATSSTATATGSGTTTAAGTKSANATVSVTGAGSVTATGTAEEAASGSATVTGSGAVSGSGQKTALGIATESGAGTVTATGEAPRSGTATVTGTGSVTATGSAAGTGSGTATVTGTGAPTAEGRKDTSGTAASTGAGTVQALASTQRSGTVTVTGTGAITASGTQGLGGSASVSGTGTTTAQGEKTALATASESATGNVVAIGVKAVSGNAVVTGTGDATVIDASDRFGLATITGAGTVSVVSVVGDAGSAVGVIAFDGLYDLALEADGRLAI